MGDLIYRQDALRTDCFGDGHEGLRAFHSYHDYRLMREYLESLPSAEPEIVRCKDCKHLFDGEHNANCCEVLMKKAKWLTEITVDMNWYCADGERREDE